jgi:hypothetical protein
MRFGFGLCQSFQACNTGSNPVGGTALTAFQDLLVTLKNTTSPPWVIEAMWSWPEDAELAADAVTLVRQDVLQPLTMNHGASMSSSGDCKDGALEVNVQSRSRTSEAKYSC